MMQRLKLWLAFCALFLTGLKLWLVAAQDLAASGFAGLDDYLFLTRAYFLRHGHWLGPYEWLTLAKGPFYPMFIAAMSWLGAPLLLAQHVLYCLACALLVLALRRQFYHPGWLLGLYLALLFSPFSFDALVTTQTLRCGIYPALTIMVLASAIGVVNATDSLRCLAWSLTLGLALTAFWLTREEGVWLLPSVVLLGVLFLWRSWRQSVRQRYASLLVVTVPVLLMSVSTASVRLINKHYYGVSYLVSVNSPAYADAYGALTRIKHSRFYPVHPVPREVRMQAYAVSPAFAELREHIEGPFSQWHSGHYGDGSDIAGGWFVWALPEAASVAGYQQSPVHADGLYQRIANEINQACDAGILNCYPPRSTLRPILHREHIEPLWRALWQGLLLNIHLARPTEPSSGHGAAITVIPQASTGTAEQLAYYREITHEKLTPGYAQIPVAQRLTWLNRLIPVYRVLGWIAFPPALIFTVYLVGYWQQQRNAELVIKMGILAALLGGLTVRILLLALIHVTSFSGLRTDYMSPAYPLFLVFCYCACYWAYQNWHRARHAS